jgi:hypothetical protein
MAIRPIIRLINPPCAGNATLEEALNNLTVMVQADILCWTTEPKLGNRQVVYVRNQEIYHALAAEHGPQRASELMACLEPRQATAFPVDCCQGVEVLLGALKRLEPFDTP